MVRGLLLVGKSRSFIRKDHVNIGNIYEIKITTSPKIMFDLLKSGEFLVVLISQDIGNDLAVHLCSLIRKVYNTLKLKIVFLCPEDSLNKYVQDDGGEKGPDICLFEGIKISELMQQLNTLLPEPETGSDIQNTHLLEPEPEEDFIDSLWKVEKRVMQEPPKKQDIFFSCYPLDPPGLVDTEAIRRSAVGGPIEGNGDFIPVWFGTNRKPVGESFGPDRNSDMVLGRVDVWVPRSHQFGECGTPWWKRVIQLRFDDDHLVIKKIVTLEKEEFFSELKEAVNITRNSREISAALVYIHGFNVIFEDAAIRAAQMGCDLKVPGPTAFFSWPSRGGITNYSADESTIEACEGPIANFLVDFFSKCGADKVHIVAHSMGNRGLLKALQRIISNAEKYGEVKFGQIFLAAPDIDRDVFLDLAYVYQICSERTTLYASDADKAIHLSALLHKAPRAGYYEPYTVVSGVDTVVVPDINFDFLGHAYFAEAEALLHDIYDLINQGLPPSMRQRIREVTKGDELFWEIIP